MCTGQSDSVIRKALKNLCCENGWSYGVFWRFDQRNSLLLTVQDAYYNEQMGTVIDDMLLQVQMLGGGVIGQTAFTKKHRWMFSDAHCDGQYFVGSTGGCDVSQDDYEFHHQFASGIKTIAVISVEPEGVLQFGSTEKIPEGSDFVNQTKRVFREMGNFDKLRLSDNSPSFSNYECYGSTGFHLLPGSKDSVRANSCLVDPIQSLSSTSGQRKMNQLHITGAESQIMISSNSSTKLQHNPCSSTWSTGDSSLTSFRYQPSELRCKDTCSVKPQRVMTCSNTENFQGSAQNSQCSSGSLINQQPSTLSLHDIESELLGPNSPSTFEELFETTNYKKSYSMDYNWFDTSLDQSNSADISMLNDDFLFETVRIVSPPYNLNGGKDTSTAPINLPANSVQSSITSASCSNGNEKCPNLLKVEQDLCDMYGVDYGYGQAGNRDDILLPVINGGLLKNNTSEYITQKHVGSTFGNRQGLFSKLGIEQLIEGISGTSISITRPSFEDQLSSTIKRKRTESSSGSSDRCYFSGLSTFQQQKEENPKLDSNSWVNDNYGMNSGHTGLQHKKSTLTAKAMKKKAKPGTRPRPKDRQQIQDRLSELRELVPNGEKMSIDCLLDRTIKYMLFLQSMTKHAETLKQIDEAKDNEKIQKNITWACEFWDQSIVCPLLVEDLRNPGQMLIEMLCEEQGFFLEIVDTIRGFGLSILKGVMEVQENKIWARFIVESEGSRHVSRHEIFSTLIQLLQVTAPSGVNLNKQLGNAIDGGTALVNNYQQSVVPLPVSLGETLHGASL